MGRRWVPVVIVVFGGLLGLAVAGFPSRESDQPLAVNTQAATSSSTSTAPTTSAPAPATSPPTSLRPARDVRVMVFNASGVTGAATRVGARIRAQGWDVGTPGADRPAQVNSIVMYRPGFDNEARSLAGALALPTSAVVALDTVVVSPGDADLAVIVGDELAERARVSGFPLLDRATAAAAIIRLGRRVSGAGLVVGAGGNISARTGTDEILVTPSGWALDEVEEQHLVVLGFGGEVRAGTARPSSEANTHLAAHRARSDFAIALHLHPPHANLLTATGHGIRLITLDHAYYVRRWATVPYLPSGTVELADAVAGALAQADVVLMAHHGCLVVGSDADLAFERAANLEAAATATFRALLLGDRSTSCPPEYLERMESLEAEAGGPVYGKGV